jgi:sarcosine oxidase subunit beta
LLVTESLPRLLHHELLDARYIAVKFGVPLGGDPDDPVNLFGVGLALEQTHEGNIIIGNTRQFAGHDREVAPEAVDAMLRYAVKSVPRLKDCSIIRSFAGLRPYTPDGLPLLGAVEGHEGLVLAAGHEGDGIALAPVTGRILSEYLCSERVPPLMAACSPGRFDLSRVYA